MGQPAAVHDADPGIANEVRVAEGTHIAPQHGDDGTFAREDRTELRRVNRLCVRVPVRTAPEAWQQRIAAGWHQLDDKRPVLQTRTQPRPPGWEPSR